jgi:TolB-like protein
LNQPIEQPAEGLWAGLRRRKVVQWGIAYVAAAWGLLQGLAYLSTVFQWPAQLQRPVTVAFLVGLPIALVLAWYHGDRGHQRVSGREFAILTVLLLIGGGLFWWVGRMPAASTATTAEGAPTPVAHTPANTKPAGTSIAVLPFVNMSGDKDNEFFSDGISEELLNVLVRVDGLGVASRTSSFAYKGSTLGTAAIANALKVNHVLEGSVRKAGNRVRITAQLIDAEDDRHLWSETYDRELTDIFAIQEEIANSIVDALQDELGPVETTAPAVTVRADTENLEAYQLYLKARELFIARRELPESMRLFEQVTQLDPGFARGWEGLAAVYAVAPSWGIVDREYEVLAKSAAEHALKLDPSLSMPWAALANAEQRSWPVDWARSLELYDRAIAADAHNATAFLWRGIVWVNLAFFERAIADFDRCLALDPQYQNCTRWKAVALLDAGKTDQAMKLFEQGVVVGFVKNRAESFIAPLVRRGDRVGAALVLRELGASSAVVARVLQAVERPAPVPAGELEALVRDVTRAARPGDQTISLTRLYLWLGLQDRIPGSNESGLTFSTPHWDPGLPGFRNSAAFKQILNSMGVPAYWRQNGFPPHCRAVGAQDFTCD